MGFTLTGKIPATKQPLLLGSLQRCSELKSDFTLRVAPSVK